MNNTLDENGGSRSVDPLGRLEAALASLKFAACMYYSASQWADRLHRTDGEQLIADEEARRGADLRRAAKAYAEAAASYE